MDFKEKVKQARRQTGLSKTAFSYALKVSPMTITRWETTETVPQATLRLKFEKFCSENKITFDKNSDKDESYNILFEVSDEKFSQLIHDIRTAAGLNKSEFARQLRVDYTSVLHWERGTSAPNLIMRERLKFFCEDYFIVFDGAVPVKSITRITKELADRFAKAVFGKNVKFDYVDYFNNFNCPGNHVIEYNVGCFQLNISPTYGKGSPFAPSECSEPFAHLNIGLILWQICC